MRGDSASPAENAPSRARPPSVVPRTRAWLLKALGWHVAVYRTRLETLLAEPGMLDLVRAAPSLGRILRPLCRMLHLPQPCPPPGHRRRTPPSAPRPAPPRREPAAPPGFIPRVAPPPQPPLCDRHVFAWPRQGPDGVLLFRRT